MKRIICRNDEHPEYSIIQQQKPRGVEVLWRYLSIEKFVHMMLTRSLFVPKLGLFDDRREGGYIESIFNRLYGRIDPQLGNRAFKLAQERFFALCFHSLECENELMWRSYAPLGGVALMTNAARLMSPRLHLEEEDACLREFYLLRVLYGEEFVGRVHPVGVKQIEYHQESEYRMVFASETLNVKRNLSVVASEPSRAGIVLKFDMDEFDSLFPEIRLSPNNTRLVRDLVQKLTPGSARITHSRIERLG